MGERLSEKKSGSIWINPDLRGYLGEVARRHGVVDSLALPNMRDLPPIQIEKLFVQPELSSKPINPQDDKWPNGESLLECLAVNRAIVLLGDPGSGKTTLINWLSWRLSSGLTRGSSNFLDDFLPIPCVLREIDPSKFESLNDVNNLASMVAERLLGSRLTEGIENAIKEYVSSHKYILMLDGVDEISIENRKIVAKWISFAKKNGAYVVATSRIVGYDEYPVHRDVLDGDRLISKAVNKWQQVGRVWLNESVFKDSGSSKSIEMEEDNFFESGDFPAFQWAVLRYLMPFDDQKIEAFIGNWYLQRSGGEIDAKERSSDLLVALKQSKATHELARTPNLLSLISIVHRERAHLPDGRALLYKEISNAYINTIDRQRRIKIDNDLLRHDWTVREGWIAYVGFRMQIERSSELGNRTFGVLVEKEKVLLWLEEIMAPFFQGDASKHAVVFLDWVARRSGLLLPKGENKYAFVHLSFQEYFCARYLSSQIINPKFIRGVFSNNDLVTHDNLEKWANESIWCESFIYLFELISSEASSDWASFVVEKLFSPSFRSVGLYNESAKLVAKILANVHISIPEEYRHALAIRCSCNDNPEVESALVRSGFAISVMRPLKEEIDNPDDLKLILKECKNNNSIYKISIRNKKVIGHPEFKKFENVEAVNMIRCDIASLYFLKNMKNLKQLKLDNSRIKNINHASHLTELKYVYLNGTNVSDVSSFRSNENLISIQLDSTKVSDISSLEDCPNLLLLSLRRTRVTDISCLKFSKNIQFLYLSDLNIKDFSVIREMKDITNLDLASTNFNNLQYICDLDDLVELNLSYMPDLDLSLLSKCKGLRKLTLNGASEKQLQHLSALEWLEELWLMTANIPNLKFISGMTQLKKLVLDGSDVSDLSPLKKARNLEYLDIENTKIFDVSMLSEMKNLKYLFVQGSLVKSIDSLKDKTDLTVFGFV